MKLKTIEILGFKSFADKTKLRFHPGITAVVGPNGCGKSNISDSFRWVFGEQSAKSMRGNKMNDVIFAGTTTRKPLNLAEVTITLSDIGGSLPTEFEEVSVTRRLHRNGDSEYLINRRPVRLKDVYDLFLDSGVGKNAFSIFEQGKLDQVINLSPLERRYIFEEAAGILRFLQRKREALKRLEHTEQNLERVRDIHKEVEKQIIVLQEQAEKAKIFKENKIELETLEISLFAVKGNNLEVKGDQLREKEIAKRKEMEQANLELYKCEIERQNGNILLGDAQSSLQKQKEKVFKARSDKEIKKRELQTGEERLREMVVKAQEWRVELDLMTAKRKERKIQAEEAQKNFEKLEEDRFRLEGVRREQQEKVHLLEEGLGGLRGRQSQAQKELLQLLQRENKAESELKQASIRFEHTHESKERIVLHILTLQKTFEESKDAIEYKRSEVERVSDETLRMKERFAMIEDKIEEKTEAIRETQTSLDQIYQEKAECKARQNVLLRLRDEMEGFSSGTKKLLKEAANPKSPIFGKIQGLYESLTPQKGAEMALSVVMRPYVQTLVVSANCFNEVILFAKANNIRDFSLISEKHLVLPSNAFEHMPEEKSLVQLVNDSIFARHFLGRKFVVKSKEEALDLVHLHPGAEVWSEEGVFVDCNGVHFFTSEGEKNVFFREAELKSLEEKLGKLELNRRTSEQKSKELLQIRSELNSQKSEIDGQIRKAEMKSLELKMNLQRLTSDFEKGEREIAKEEGEIRTHENALSELSFRLQDLKQELSQAKERAMEVQGLTDSLSEELNARVDLLKLEQNDLIEKDRSFQKTSEEIRKVAHMLNVLEVKDLESLQQEKRLEDEIKSIEEKEAKLQLSRAAFAEELKEVEFALSEVSAACLQLEEVVSERREALDKIEEIIVGKRDALKQRELELYEMGIQAAQLASSFQALERELQERFHLTLAAAAKQAASLDRTIEKAERDVRALRRRLEEAGDINMTSIEEFDKHKERYEFLNQQIDDLVVSKGELIEIITQLDTESRKVFKETFEVIRQNFMKNFQILFRGGESDLQFTEASDILEAGIEIVAKPPGKQMRSINLLSGGEKCLTAIALLFAIFEVKPAPFCILDEIDAPLDDTNVERFVNVVKQFTDKCQFIIITHNKRTMAIADVLYGVSMQEKGVSKLLSLEFSSEKEPEPSLV